MAVLSSGPRPGRKLIFSGIANDHTWPLSTHPVIMSPFLRLGVWTVNKTLCSGLSKLASKCWLWLCSHLDLDWNRVFFKFISIPAGACKRAAQFLPSYWSETLSSLSQDSLAQPLYSPKSRGGTLTETGILVVCDIWQRCHHSLILLAY